MLLSVTKVYEAPGSKLTAEQRGAIFIYKCYKLHICELPIASSQLIIAHC